jgi:hypothetical protein
MADILYTSVTWTVGDVITEAKLDAMVANDRAVDSHDQGMLITERAIPSTPSSNKLYLYAKDNSGVSGLFVINDAGTNFEVGERQPMFVFTIVGTLATGTSMTPLLVAPRTLTIIKAYANVKTAPTGAALIFDINKNGTSIWASTQANRVQIAASATSGTKTSFDTTALSEGDVLTLDVDQVGSTIAGADATISLKCK